MSDFSGKNIVVTGAAPSIRAAVVSRASALGAKVVGLDINKGLSESVVSGRGTDAFQHARKWRDLGQSKRR